MSETQLVSAILKALAIHRVWAWRANSGTQVLAATKAHARRVIRGAPAGTPDILLVIPNTAGQLAGIEVKTATGKLRPSQEAWRKKAITNGVRYGVARSVRDALNLLASWEYQAQTIEMKGA